MKKKGKRGERKKVGKNSKEREKINVKLRHVERKQKRKEIKMKMEYI